jgi:hypothetical protein
MKTRASLFTRVTLAFLFFCGLFLAVSSTSGVAAADRHRDRCKRHCEDAYNRRKSECRHRGRDKHRCEEEAKRERDDCKDRCR